MPEPEVAPTPTPETPPAEPKPNPLEPGGERFSEVYASWKTAERELARLNTELEGVKLAQRQPPAQPAQEPKFYTPQQLQAMADAGQISPAIMADQLAWQRAEQSKQQYRQEERTASVQKTALTEVNEYIEQIPALGNQSSPEFQKTKRAAIEIADEMGLRLDDVRVQRRALREVFGPPERAKAAAGAVDRSRSRADTFAEEGGGGGREDSRGNTDPLKGIPDSYRKHWERLGYTPEQMKDEAKWITPGLERRSGRRPTPTP